MASINGFSNAVIEVLLVVLFSNDYLKTTKKQELKYRDRIPYLGA